MRGYWEQGIEAAHGAVRTLSGCQHNSIFHPGGRALDVPLLELHGGCG